MGPASPAHGPRSPLSRRAPGARPATRREIQTAGDARVAAGREGAAASSTDGRLPFTPISPVSPPVVYCLAVPLRSPWGTMVTTAGLRARCGAQGLPSETCMVPQLGAPGINRVCPWDSSVAAAKSLVHQKLCPPTTCALAEVEGVNRPGNSKAEALTGRG